LTKKIATKLDSRAVFLFLSSCHLASTAFGGDANTFYIEGTQKKQHTTQMNEGKSNKESRELDQSPPMHDPEHIKRFRESIFDICTKYLDSRKEDDVKETWAVFFSLLEKNKSLKGEFEGILKDLPEESQCEQDSKNRLIDWYKEYAQNLPITPNFSLSSRAIKRRYSAALLNPLRPSL